MAIFADTQDEPADVYRHLERLEHDFGHVVPIRRVTAGRLSAAIDGKGNRFAAPPFYVRNRKGVDGMLRRQCTREYKIEPILREVRRMLGVAKGCRVPKGVTAEAWQGISLDEVTRMKQSRTPWVTNRYSLVFEHPMTVHDCKAYNLDRGYPAPKSACVFCPYTDDHRWRTMKRDRPDEFAEAVRVDHLVRDSLAGVNQQAYVHRSLMPLDEVDFSSAEDLGQTNFFENECEGMCGV